MKLRELFWKPVAWLVSRKPVFNYLRKRAMKTPYFHLPGYMNRYWLFNRYDHDTHRRAWWGEWLPSIRIHHILRADVARHLHDHPWNARTIICDGDYIERVFHPGCNPAYWPGREWYKYNNRNRGDTARILFEQYHSIDKVSDGGVWTIFITYKYKGGWGFMVNGTKIPWREYEEKYPT